MKNRRIKVLRTTNSGFTFLEVMISLLLLMIGIVFLIDLFPIALKNFKKSKDITMATFLVQEKMEEIRNLSADQEIPCVSESPDPSNPQFKYTIGEKNWPFEDSPDYKEVRVKVKHFISKAYAEASTVKRSLSKVDGDLFALTLPAGTPYYYNVLFFATKPKSSEIYYSDGKYAGGFYDKDSGWKTLGCLPSGEEADKVSAGVCFVNVADGGVAIAGGTVFVYATDKKGNLYGAVYFLNVASSINLTVARSWTPVKANAPCMPQ